MQSKLQKIADVIDSSVDTDTLRAVLIEIKELVRKESNALNRAILYFYLANAYSKIRIIIEERNKVIWSNSELENEVYSLRLALTEFKTIPLENDRTDLRFRVSTNLANALNHIGRFSEAIETWDNVIKEYPDFSMAIANRGQALMWYAWALYDENDHTFFLHEGYHSIKKALELGVEEHAVDEMKDHLDFLNTMADWETVHLDFSSDIKYETDPEKNYRKWALENRLFLNPLNDLGSLDMAKNDTLTFPSVVILKEKGKATPPEVYGIYNQLKQEYVSARYMLFEAIELSKQYTHFSDKDVKLYDMLDYRHFSLWIEKIKMVFLSAYAIFDKIAYLVNEYWQLNLPVRSVSFNTVWFKNASFKKGISETFTESENWALRGLYWVSKDLYYISSPDQPMEPEARNLNHIRNHITHKYLKVYDHLLCDTETWRENEGHELSYPISDLELKDQTVKLLKLVRSALIYVSLGAHHNERIANKDINDEQLVQVQLHEIEDGFRF